MAKFSPLISFAAFFGFKLLIDFFYLKKRSKQFKYDFVVYDAVYALFASLILPVVVTYVLKYVLKSADKLPNFLSIPVLALCILVIAFYIPLVSAGYNMLMGYSSKSMKTYFEGIILFLIYFYSPVHNMYHLSKLDTPVIKGKVADMTRDVMRSSRQLMRGKIF